MPDLITRKELRDYTCSYNEQNKDDHFKTSERLSTDVFTEVVNLLYSTRYHVKVLTQTSFWLNGRHQTFNQMGGRPVRYVYEGDKDTMSLVVVFLMLVQGQEQLLKLPNLAWLYVSDKIGHHQQSWVQAALTQLCIDIRFTLEGKLPSRDDLETIWDISLDSKIIAVLGGVETVRANRNTLRDMNNWLQRGWI